MFGGVALEELLVLVGSFLTEEPSEYKFSFMVLAKSINLCLKYII